jgi:hypothetical protein
MKLDNSQRAFFELLKAGLWADTTVNDSWFMVHGSVPVDWERVYQLAEEQSVVGVVLAGIEYSNVKPPQELLLQWIGEVQILEQQNKAMNQFIAELIEKMRKSDVNTLLVKGQGIAQCYERPLWRASGDVDLFLDEVNYQKAAKILPVLASFVEDEDKAIRHLAMTIGEFEVELHGTLCSQIRKSVDNGLMDVQKDTFENKRFRIWCNNDTDVFLPSANNDVIFVFAHIYQHFFKEGIGLRQICDWCRLLWTYKDEIDRSLLETRLKRMELMDKWHAFAALAVEYLEMPVDAMPFYSPSKKWKKKADGIIALILESGNFGHAVDKSYKYKYSTIIRAIVAASHHTSVAFRHFLIFPYDSFLGWTKLMSIGIRANLK